MKTTSTSNTPNNRTGKTRVTTFDRKSYEENKTAVAVIMNHFLLRYLNLLYREFDGDLLLPIVLGEIAHHNIIRIYSSTGNCHDVRDQIKTGTDLRKNLAPTNAYSISEATGIPRETVRRKIDKLIKKAWLVKNTQGDLTISETVGPHFMKDFNIHLLEELLDASGCINQLLKSEK
jgi:Holliday junction resolvase RusA-like endonuclease